MTMVRGSIYSLLRPGLKQVFGGYHKYPDQYKEFLDIVDSDKSEESYTQVRLLGYAQVKPEGTGINTDPGPAQKYLIRIVNETVGNSFVMTKEAMEDNLYEKEFPMSVKALRDSMVSAKELAAASFMVDGFSVNEYDGVPLFSANHPTDAGSISNLIAGDPSEATINDAMILVNKFTDQAGLPVQAMIKKAIISPKNYFIFSKLCGSDFSVQTANNDPNPIKRENIIPEGYRINRYMQFVSATGQNAWFLTTSIPGLVLQQRKKIEYDTKVEEFTGTVRTFASERYGIGVRDFMSVVGSPGA